MSPKSVFGRKVLNAMIRHIAFYGRMEMPASGEFEHGVVSQLVADRKLSVHVGKWNDYVVLIDGKQYQEEHNGNEVHPLVVHLALENPRNEELAVIFRKNHVVPVLSEVEFNPEGWDYL
jgi:hypothetical protein